MNRKTGNLKHVAEYLGVSYTTARNLQAKGLPMLHGGRRGVAAIIDLDEAKRWYIEDFQQTALWQEQRDQLMAQKAKLDELAKRRKALLHDFLNRGHEMD